MASQLGAVKHLLFGSVIGAHTPTPRQEPRAVVAKTREYFPPTPHSQRKEAAVCLHMSTAMMTYLVGVAAVPLAKVGPMMPMPVKEDVAREERVKDG